MKWQATWKRKKSILDLKVIEQGENEREQDEENKEVTSRLHSTKKAANQISTRESAEQTKSSDWFICLCTRKRRKTHSRRFNHKYFVWGYVYITDRRSSLYEVFTLHPPTHTTKRTLQYAGFARMISSTSSPLLSQLFFGILSLSFAKFSL